MNELNDLHVFSSKNADVIITLREKLNILLGIVDNVTDKTYYKRANEILQYLDEYEQYNNIARFCNEEICCVNMYELFDTFYTSYRAGINSNQRNNINYSLNGELVVGSDMHILSKAFTIQNCLPIMKIIPTLILDNALKYSIGGTDINIDLEQTEYGKKLSLTNIGPQLEIDEVSSVFSLYRGRNAQASTIQGQGVGLNIVKQIFMPQKWLSPDIEVVSCDSEVVIHNGIPYSKFVITLFYDDNDLNDMSDKSLDVSSVDYIKFITHEFIRIYPKLCRSGISLYDRASSQNKEILDNQGLLSLCYEIKDIIFEFYIYLLLYDSDFYNTEEKEYDQSKRFDKYLIKEIAYLSGIKGVCYEENVNDKFSSFVIYPPLTDVFIHILVKDLVNQSLEDEIVVNIDEKYIELLTNNPLAMDTTRIEVLNKIIRPYSLELIVSEYMIEIAKS